MKYRRNFIHRPPLKKQRGYIILMVGIFLLTLLALSAQFFNSANDSSERSGLYRDTTEARLLAESVMNKHYGQFANKLDYRPNGQDDSTDAAAIQMNKGDFRTLARIFLSIPYAFAITHGNGIDHKTPDLLQRIANGEAADVPPGRLRTRTQLLFSPPDKFRVNDLFSRRFQPRLFTVNSSAALVEVMDQTWDEVEGVKAAVWIEVVESVLDEDGIDLFVSAVADVDGSKSYLRRRVNSYLPVVGLGSISLVSEATNVDRSN